MNKFAQGGLAALALAIAAPVAQAQQNQIEASRALVEKWVELRQIISKEKSQWRSQKEIIENRIDLFEKEIEENETTIAKAAKASDKAEADRKQLSQEEQELRDAGKNVNEALPVLEAQMRELSEYFPKPLMDRESVGKFVRELPKSGEEIAGDRSMRMLRIVSLLNELDKFNSEVTQATDSLTLEDGTTVIVDVLYLGVSIGYFADESLKHAGIMVPAKGEWEFKPMPEHAKAIRLAMAMSAGEEKPATYQSVPAEIKEAQFSE